jgi:trehalose 6-phosphate phosphatase
MKTQQIDFITTLQEQRCLRFFFDYDGTLADFAPNPDILLPNKRVITLLNELTAAPGVLTSVISGRRLGHLQKLLPVPGMFLAGTYGIEAQLADGKPFTQVPYERIRPTIERVLPLWEEITRSRTDVFLEDKGWALAIHVSHASVNTAAEVIQAAREALHHLEIPEYFHVVGDRFFVELLPIQANKTSAVEWVLNTFTPGNCLPIYFGDDENDEQAFLPIIKAGGVAFRISAKEIPTRAQFQLASPAEVLEWIENFLLVRKHPSC